MGEYRVDLALDKLRCTEEGDGSGNAEPFIWSAFFKIDDHTATLENMIIVGKGIREKPVEVHFGAGSHNNLTSTVIDIAADGIDTGIEIPIPPAVGFWNTAIKPFWLENPRKAEDRLPVGVAGMFFMLLEEDSVPHYASLAGRQAFNRFFEEKINYFFHSLDLPHIYAEIWQKREAGLVNASPEERERAREAPVTFEELKPILDRKTKEFKKEIESEGKDVVVAAIKDTLLANLDVAGAAASLYDTDDFLGADMQVITIQELDKDPVKTFAYTWPSGTPAELAGGGGIEFAGDSRFVLTGYIRRLKEAPSFTDESSVVEAVNGGAVVFKSVNFEGESMSLKPGSYRLGAHGDIRRLVRASPFDKDIDSVKVDRGYYAELYKTNDFTGEMLEVTHDNPVAWFDDNWRDQVSSIKVGRITDRLG